MRHSRPWSCCLTLTAVSLYLSACANPVPPTGGPTDTTPPAIVEMVPADGTTLVGGEELHLLFSEYVDEASFQRAFSITPAFQGRPDFIWRGRSVRIRFPEPLRENTTYVVQIDNNLRDVRGVSLSSPITVAFATGPQIDRGLIHGRVVEPLRGRRLAGVDVYAYRNLNPDAIAELPDVPDYRTQTGPEGQFVFRYLPVGETFYVVAVRDENANRRPDSQEAVAPPPQALFVADTVSSQIVPLYIVSIQDTLPPSIQRTRQISSRRIAVRFSEPVVLGDTARWAITSASTDRTALGLPYVLDAEPREVVLMTDSLAPGEYRLAVGSVADTVGNRMSASVTEFILSAIADTTQPRFVRFDADTTARGFLRPNAWPRIIFASGVEELSARSRVSVRDTSGTPLEYRLLSNNNADWQVILEDEVPSTFEISVHAYVADTSVTRGFETLPQTETGELSGVTIGPDVPILVEVYRPGMSRPDRSVVVGADRTFLVRSLPEGVYYVRGIADADTSGSWSPGRIAPYRTPELLAWIADSVRVRARWETALEDTLRFVPEENFPQHETDDTD